MELQGTSITSIKERNGYGIDTKDETEAKKVVFVIIKSLEMYRRAI